jgi:formylglycine-generating enzyme required for sulfatase activity
MSKVLTVDDLPNLLAELPPGWAAMYPNFEAREGEDEDLPAYIGYPMWVARVETTQGMYAEFLRDLEANRERIPDWWLKTKTGDQRREDVQLGYHAPLAWRTYDPADPTRVLSWNNNPADANYPVTQITVHDAYGFAEWATARFAAKGRRIKFALPVLWEWQRAARAGNLDNLWPWGSEKLFFACNSRAFWGRDNRGSLLPVAWWYGEPPGTGGATSEGLFGMAGNAREMARSQLPRKTYDPINGIPRFTWAEDETAPMAWMCGGSYKSGIDDCSVESAVNVAFDKVYDDLGFRLFVREPIE